MSLIEVDIEQRSPGWLELRKIKITATDAPVIMGENPWKNAQNLLGEKLGLIPPSKPNAAMKRGMDLEEKALSCFIMKTGIQLFPKVFVREWQMASLDGVSRDGKTVVEIKCPMRDHLGGLNNMIPKYYYGQLQHQMHVLGIDHIFYFSFDGYDGVVVDVKKDNTYIEEMIDRELEFFIILNEERKNLNILLQI